MILSFPDYLEKVEIVKAYNDLLREFTDFETNPQKNIFLYRNFYLRRRKDLEIDDKRFEDELVVKFGKLIHIYYEFANEFKDEYERLENFFNILFLGCLLECYKSEEADIFFCEEISGNFFPNVFSSVSEERRNVMLSKLEKGWIESDQFALPNKAFGISLEEIPLTVPEKYTKYFYSSIFYSDDSEKFSFLNKAIESEESFENFIDCVIDAELYDTAEWDSFVECDRKKILTRILNMGSERNDFIKTIVKKHLLFKDENGNFSYNLDTLSPKGKETLFSIFEKIESELAEYKNISESIDFYRQYIKTIPC